MLKREPGELGFEQFDRLDTVHQPGVARQRELRAEPADDVESKGVECSDPHRSGLFGAFVGDPLRHLARRFVRVGENEEPARVHALVDELDDPGGKRLCFPRSRAGL